MSAQVDGGWLLLYLSSSKLRAEATERGAGLLLRGASCSCNEGFIRHDDAAAAPCVCAPPLLFLLKRTQHPRAHGGAHCKQTAGNDHCLACLEWHFCGKARAREVRRFGAGLGPGSRPSASRSLTTRSSAYMPQRAAYHSVNVHSSCRFWLAGGGGDENEERMTAAPPRSFSLKPSVEV